MRLLSMDELKPVKGISYSRPHLFRLIKAGRFPAPIKIGENRNAWPESEIDSWVEQRIVERDAPESVMTHVPAKKNSGRPNGGGERLEVRKPQSLRKFK